MNIKTFFPLVIMIIAGQAKASDCSRLIENYYNYIKEVKTEECLTSHITTNNKNIGRVGYSSSELHIGRGKVGNFKYISTKKSDIVYNLNNWKNQPNSYIDLKFTLTNAPPPSDTIVSIKFYQWNTSYTLENLQCADELISGKIKSKTTGGVALVTLSFKKSPCLTH